MENNQIYAVVDIETTGTDPKIDRIIQFGCVLIQNGEVISRFATDINPNQAITKQIQHLTGISNTRVRKAPYFEDVAHTIYNLLENTVFVAHNIHFDYSFLKHELVRCGTPKLEITGIDTVELAQIFLPTEKSFRLIDLAKSLGLDHNNPHQADSDAQVTAELLLLIETKMKKLPLVTMEMIDQLSILTAMDTTQYIHDVYGEMKKEVCPLSKDIHVVEGIALRRKAVTLFEENLYEAQAYPLNKKNKEKQFNQKILYRLTQNRMMNLVYKHFTEDEAKNLFIEAATGTGKTLGYLFPMSYLATPKNPLILSTVSIILQNQLANKEIPLINQISPVKIQACVVKSHRHYIDLQRFKATLNAPVKQKQYAIYQMGILVWLTETETGDFDELQLTSFAHNFWNDVAHHGIDFLTKKDGLFEEDFVRFLHKKMKQSNVLIVNHAFLVQESVRKHPLLPKSRYLIIDEAHHLPDIAVKVAAHNFNYASFKKKAWSCLDSDHLFDQIRKILIVDQHATHLLKVYSKGLVQLLEEIDELFYSFDQLLDQPKKNESVLINKESIELLSDIGQQAVSRIEIILPEMLEIQTQIQHYFTKELERFTASDRLLLVNLLNFFDQLNKTKQCFDIYFGQWSARWIKEYTKIGSGACLLTVNDLESCKLPNSFWYTRYEKILYTSGTLKFGNNKNYLPKQLGIDTFIFNSLPDPYDYQTNARIYVPSQDVLINQFNLAELATYISTILKQLSRLNQPILVLFTSHEALAAVYYQLHPFMLDEGKELLAQGISGSREKIIKRFAHGRNSLLLGADSFWEGIDLPGEALSILVVTRLPFENPQRTFVHERYEYLESQGINPFTQDALPKAALRLRQALGRIIRSEKDKGALLVLDRRLVTAKYGKRMIKALPKKIPILEKTIEEIVDDLSLFLNQ